MTQRSTAPRLVVVTGKGGVGKTTVACVLARRRREAAARVLVLEVDPRENAHRLFGAPPSGGEAVEVEEGLLLQNLRPRSVLDRVIEEQLRVGVLARRVLRSPLYHQFAEGCPGLKELAILGHALRALRGQVEGLGGAVDAVVLDAPASGHGLALLRAPALVSEVVEVGPFGSLARELAAAVADPATTGVVVVTVAEEMPVQEALETIEQLEAEQGRGPLLVVVNRNYPPWPEGEEPQDRLGRLWRRRLEVGRRQRARLVRRWSGPTADLPLLPMEAGPPLLSALGRRLASDGPEVAE